MAVTLHDEMVAVLREAGRALASAEIAVRVNRRDKYHVHVKV